MVTTTSWPGPMMWLGRMAFLARADDDPEPRFGRLDTAFRWGRVGLGSFDETGDFDDLRIEGEPRSECR